MSFLPENKKKIILHIGLPKTGSTALQHALYRDRERLRQHGVLYPAKVHRPEDPKHNYVLDLIRKGQEYDLCTEEGYQAASRIIISNEAISNDFYQHGQQRNQQFAESLREHGELEICVVLRKSGDWLKSYFKQAVINQAVKGKPHYQNSLPLEIFRELEPVRRLLDYGNLLQDVSMTFGAPVRIMRYEEVRMEDVIRYCTGFPFAPTAFDNRHNESLSDAAVEVMRQLNKHIQTLEEKCAWSCLLKRATGGSHGVLNILADRANSEAVAALEAERIDSLCLVPAEAPNVDEHEFSVLVASLRRQLMSSQNGQVQ